MIRNVLVSMTFLVLALPAQGGESTPITIEAVVQEMNACRLAAGLPALRSNELLEEAAGDRVRDMEELAYWAHQSPDGRSPFTWVKSRGYDFAYAGENLATGYETTEILVASWMESKGHRENIMSPIYDEVGVAIIEGSTTRRSVGKSVVVLFARHQSPEPKAKPKPLRRPAITPGVISTQPPPRAAAISPHTFGGPVIVPGTNHP